MTCVPGSEVFGVDDLVATVVTDAEWGELTVWLVDDGDGAQPLQSTPA